MIEEILIQRIDNGVIARISKPTQPTTRNYFTTLAEALEHAAQINKAEDEAAKVENSKTHPAHNFLRGNKS